MALRDQAVGVTSQRLEPDKMASVVPLGFTGALILTYAAEGEFLVAVALLIVLIVGIIAGIEVSRHGYSARLKFMDLSTPKKSADDVVAQAAVSGSKEESEVEPKIPSLETTFKTEIPFWRWTLVLSVYRFVDHHDRARIRALRQTYP
jgi:hypothetical protein